MNAEYMAFEAAAAYLYVSTSKLYKMTHKREIAYHKVGRLNVFAKKDLEKYLEDHRVKSIDELKVETESRMQKFKATG